MLDPSEKAKASPLMDKMAKGMDDTILVIYGEIKEGKKEFAVPVDSTAQILAFSVFFQCMKSITIVDPAGAQVNAGPHVEEAIFHAGRLVNVDTPRTGLWRIKIEGAGMYSVVVHAKSTIQFTKAEFVEGTESAGFVAIKGPPKAGVSQTLRATLSGTFSTAQFVLMTMDGMPSVFKMTRTNESTDPAEFRGDITPPSQPFRIIAEGVDQNGQIYRRFFPPLFRTAP